MVSDHVANVAMTASATNGFLNSVALIASNSGRAHSSVDQGACFKSTFALEKAVVKFATTFETTPAQLTCASKSTPGVIPHKRPRSSATAAPPLQLLTTSSDSSCSDDLVIDVERLDSHDITSNPDNGKDIAPKHKLENISLPQTSAASTAGSVFPTTSPTGAKRLKLTCHGVTTYRSLDGDILAQAFEAPCKTPRQESESFKENRRSTASTSISDKQSIGVAVLASEVASCSSVESAATIATNGTSATTGTVATTPTTLADGSLSQLTPGNSNGARPQKRSQNTSAKMENLHLHLARIAKGKTLQQQQTGAEAAQSPVTSQVASDKNVDQLAAASSQFACNSSNLLTAMSASPSSGSSVGSVTGFNFNLTPAHVGYKSPIISQTTPGLKTITQFEEEPIELTTGRKEQPLKMSAASASVATSVVGEAAVVANVESFEGPLELTTQMVKERQKHLQKLSSSPSP